MVKILVESPLGQRLIVVDPNSHRLLKIRELQRHLQSELQTDEEFTFHFRGKVLGLSDNVPIDTRPEEVAIAIARSPGSLDQDAPTHSEKTDGALGKRQLMDWIQGATINNLFFQCTISTVGGYPQLEAGPLAGEILPGKRVKAIAQEKPPVPVPESDEEKKRREFSALQQKQLVDHLKLVAELKTKQGNKEPKFLHINKPPAAAQPTQPQEKMEEGEIAPPAKTQTPPAYAQFARLTNKTSLESNILQRRPHNTIENRSSILFRKKDEEPEAPVPKKSSLDDAVLAAKGTPKSVKEGVLKKMQNDLLEETPSSSEEEEMTEKRKLLAIKPHQEGPAAVHKGPSSTPAPSTGPSKQVPPTIPKNQDQRPKDGAETDSSDHISWEKIDFVRLGSMSKLQLQLLFTGKKIRYRLFLTGDDHTPPKIGNPQQALVRAVLSLEELEVEPLEAPATPIHVSFRQFFELFIDKKTPGVVFEAPKTPQSKPSFSENFRKVDCFKAEVPQTAPKSLALASETPSASHKKLNSEGKNRTDSHKKAIYKQVNYWFSDKNYPTDPFFAQHATGADRAVPIEFLLSFPRLKKLTKSLSLVAEVVTEFQVQPDCNFELVGENRIRKKGILGAH